jgi:HEPN domain-containing protein
MKATEPSLSRHLLVEARKFILYPNRVRKQHDAAAIINEILDRFVEAQEWVVSDADFGKLSPPDPKRRRLTCDEVYSKALLEKIPKMAERTVKLGALSTREPLTRGANLCLREATRSYVFGLWDATCALSRAALEEALEDRLKRLLGPVKNALEDLITTAERSKLLDRPHAERAGRIQRRGNMVLHERQAVEEDAWMAITDLRAILAYLYGVAPSQSSPTPLPKQT